MSASPVLMAGARPNPARRLRALVFLDHSITIRHFIASGVFEELRRRHDVRFVTLPEGHRRITGADLSSIAGDLVRLPEHEERLARWKRLFHVYQIRRRKEPHLNATASAIELLLGPPTARLYRWLGRWPLWPVYKRVELARIAARRNDGMEALFDDFRPDAVIYPTVLQGSYLDDLVDVARRREVPVVAIMNSWDNPSTKRAMFGAPDWLLVWGKQTEGHAIRFAQMDPSRVVRFGAAQFEIYRQPPRLDPKEFRQRYGLRPDTVVILYAGSSKYTDEYADLDRLEAAVEDGRLAGTAILYRPHPWGNCGLDGQRIGRREWRHVRFESSMEEYVRRAVDGRQPVTTPDYRHTHDLLANVDAVISPLSTILIEAALMGCAPLCVIEEKSASASFDRQLPMVHFQEFLASPVLGTTCTHATLVDETIALAARAREPGATDRLRDAAAWFVEPHDEPYDRRLADFVESISVGAAVTR